jgi:hypothetical protein
MKTADLVSLGLKTIANKAVMIVTRRVNLNQTEQKTSIGTGDRIAGNLLRLQACQTHYHQSLQVSTATDSRDHFDKAQTSLYVPP